MLSIETAYLGHFAFRSRNLQKSRILDANWQILIAIAQTCASPGPHFLFSVFAIRVLIRVLCSSLSIRALLTSGARFRRQELLGANASIRDKNERFSRRKLRADGTRDKHVQSDGIGDKPPSTNGTRESDGTRDTAVQSDGTRDNPV